MNKFSKEDKNKKKISRGKFATIVITVAVTVIATVSAEIGLGIVSIVPKENYDRYKKFEKLAKMEEMISETYYKDIKENDLIDGAMKGLFLGTGDPYSEYYTEEEMNLVKESTSGSFVGIGITMLSDPETGIVEVTNSWETGPAYKSGIRAGDTLYKVEDVMVSYDTLDKAVSIMKGEEGKEVNVSVKRDGEIKKFKIKRAQVSEPSVTGKMMDDKVGYIQISTFIEKTSADFRKELTALKKDGMRYLVLDLRNNGGGMVDQCCEVADELIGEGTIVYTEDRNGNREEEKSDKNKLNLPIAVLTNENTASSSEILTGAIIGNKAGISVGTTTFGKGIVQSVVELHDKTGYKLTTAQYFTPDGKSIHEKGIKPTIEVKDEEAQLYRAIKWLKTGK